MLKLQPTERNFILITLSLVMILGAQAVHSLMKEDLESGAVEASAAVADGRQPASLGETKPFVKSLSQMVDLDLSCAKKSRKDLAVAGTFLQLKGKNCLKGFDREHIEIVNQTNGYTASIFAFGQNRYQTDLIQLRSGENQIRIRHQSKSGSVFEEILKVHSSSI